MTTKYTNLGFGFFLLLLLDSIVVAARLVPGEALKQRVDPAHRGQAGPSAVGVVLMTAKWEE